MFIRYLLITMIIILFYILELEIIHGNGISVLASCRFELFKYAALLQYTLEIVERLVVVEVDLIHQIEDPLTLDDKLSALAANDGLLTDDLFLLHDLGLVGEDGRQRL
jgi:hypothetical protein